MGWFKKKKKKIELTNQEENTLSKVIKQCIVSKDEIEIVSEDIQQLYKDFDIQEGWVAVPEIPEDYIGDAEFECNIETGQQFWKIKDKQFLRDKKLKELGI